MSFKAQVRGGRLVLDEPVDLPDGTEVELTPVDDGDSLDAADRAKLHAALRRAAAQLDAGQGIDADEALRLFCEGVPALDIANARYGLVSSEDIKGETSWCVVPKSYKKRDKLFAAGWRLATARQWLEARWATCVVREMGEAHRPSSRRGAAITLIDERRPDYLAKLGLEMSDAGSKEGRKGSRTAWQIAADWAAHPTQRDEALWREYAAGYKGMRKLTWSRGAQEALLPEVPELSDEELAQAADQKDGADDEVVCKLDHRVYQALWATGLDVDFLASVESGLRGDDLAARLNELLCRTLNVVIPIMDAA